MTTLDTVLDDPRLRDPAFIGGLSDVQRSRLRDLVVHAKRVRGDWQQDPVGWVQTVPRGFVSQQQAEVLTAIRDHRRTIVVSSHSTGKTKTMARAACWWIDAHPPGEALVVSTAPTYAQVAGALWKEVLIEHRAGELPGRIRASTQWVTDDGVLIGFGKRPRDYQEVALQGYHARYVLVVIDECAGVPAALWEQAEKLATGPQHRIVAIGNADFEGSHYHQEYVSGDWHSIRLPAFGSPAFTGEPCPPEVLDVLVHPEWVKDRAERLGIGSSDYMRQVTAEFPLSRDDVLIPRAWLYGCVHPDQAKDLGSLLREPAKPVKLFGERALPGVQLGIDVAAGGADTTVIYERRGHRLGRRWEINTADSEALVDKAVEAVDATGADTVAVDAIGVGWGVAGSLARRRPGVNVLKIVVSESPWPNPEKDWPAFKTKRDQAWWMARELSRLGKWDLTLGAYDEAGIERRDAKLIGDLSAFPYEERNGLVLVASKDTVREELGRSPDDGDAAILAFVQPWGRQRAVVGVGTGVKESFRSR